MSIVLEKRNQISRTGHYVNQLGLSRAVFEGCNSILEGKKMVLIGINGPEFELTQNYSNISRSFFHLYTCM